LEIVRQAAVAELLSVEVDRPVAKPYPAIRNYLLFWEPVPPVASKNNERQKNSVRIVASEVKGKYFRIVP